jgi:hypothetical protein
MFFAAVKAAAERFLGRVRPDLVIVDYGLLGGSRINAAQMAAANNVPVVVMSGYDRVGRAPCQARPADIKRLSDRGTSVLCQVGRSARTSAGVISLPLFLLGDTKMEAARRQRVLAEIAACSLSPVLACANAEI